MREFNFRFEKAPVRSDVNVARVPDNRVRCEICGSTVSWKRNSRNMSSSAPGGDISRVTEKGIPVQICLCGNLMQSGKLRRISIIYGADWESFHGSLAAAQHW